MPTYEVISGWGNKTPFTSVSLQNLPRQGDAVDLGDPHGIATVNYIFHPGDNQPPMIVVSSGIIERAEREKPTEVGE